MQRLINSILLLTFFYTNYYFFNERVIPEQSKYKSLTNYNRDELKKGSNKKLKNFNATLKIKRIEKKHYNHFLAFLSYQDYEVYYIDVTNETDEAFESCLGKGSINISYHFIKPDGSIMPSPEIRSFFLKKILPKESAVASVVVIYPKNPGEYILRFSLVQEFNTWFYWANPSCKVDYPFPIVIK